jgi:hypothetical protein
VRISTAAAVLLGAGLFWIEVFGLVLHGCARLAHTLRR